MSVKIIYLIFLIIGSSAVAVADVFIKKASVLSSFPAIFKNIWMIFAVLLYLLQIFIFAYLFSAGLKLSYVGIVQIILYALIVLLSSVLFFRETLTLFEAIGMTLGIIGIILINL